MKQTPLRLLAVAAATALVFTACGGDDDNNAPSGYHPGGGSSPAAPTVPGAPGGNPTPYVPTPPAPTDTSSSDSGSDTSDTSDTSDACADPNSTDTACVPTSVLVTFEDVPIDATDHPFSIALTPPAAREITVTAQTPYTKKDITITPNSTTTPKDGKYDFKLTMPTVGSKSWGDKGNTIELQVTDKQAGLIANVTPIDICGDVSPAPHCGATAAKLTSPTTVGAGDALNFELTPQNAAIFRLVTIAANTPEVTLTDGGGSNIGNSIKMWCSTKGEIALEIDSTGTLTSGETFQLAVEDPANGVIGTFDFTVK